jgi:hypothetical protein
MYVSMFATKAQISIYIIIEFVCNEKADISRIFQLLQISMLTELGGNNVEEFVKRMMRFLLSDELARQFNFSGRQKRSFSAMTLFDVVYS